MRRRPSEEGPRGLPAAADVLRTLAETLDAQAALARFPGLTREGLRRILARAATDAGSVMRASEPAREAPQGPTPPAVPHADWPKELVAHIDGAARGNPGEAGAGVVISDRAGTVLERAARYLGHATNNTAEYQALLIALATAREAGAERLCVFSDSELLVNQVNGRYKTRMPHLQQYLQEAIRLIREIGRVDVTHVRRELNAAADALANQAIDEHHGRR